MFRKFKNNFKKRHPSYDVRVLMVHESNLDDRLKLYQNQGWEISGDILVKNRSGHCLDTNLFIPFKKQIK